MGLFTPEWNHSDCARALRAVRAETKEKTLVKAALSSRHPAVQLEATEKLTSAEALETVAKNAADASLRCTAAKKLPPDSEVRRAVFLKEAPAILLAFDVRKHASFFNRENTYPKCLPDPKELLPLFDAATRKTLTAAANLYGVEALSFLSDEELFAALKERDCFAAFRENYAALIARFNEEDICALARTAKSPEMCACAAALLSQPALIEQALPAFAWDARTRDLLQKKLIAADPVLYGTKYPESLSCSDLNEKLPQELLCSVICRPKPDERTEQAALYLTDPALIAKVLSGPPRPQNPTESRIVRNCLITLIEKSDPAALAELLSTDRFLPARNRENQDSAPIEAALARVTDPGMRRDIVGSTRDPFIADRILLACRDADSLADCILRTVCPVSFGQMIRLRGMIAGTDREKAFLSRLEERAGHILSDTERAAHALELLSRYTDETFDEVLYRCCGADGAEYLLRRADRAKEEHELKTQLERIKQYYKAHADVRERLTGHNGEKRTAHHDTVEDCYADHIDRQREYFVNFE